MDKTLFTAIAMCLLSLSLAGCFVLSQREEVVFLQDLAANQNRMQAYVTEEERLFEKLVSDIKNNRLKSGMPESRVASLYGEPIFCRAQGEDNTKQLCIYHAPTVYFQGNSAYLYFDENRRLSSWELITPQVKQ